jgi:hypothetical protein
LGDKNGGAGCGTVALVVEEGVAVAGEEFEGGGVVVREVEEG